jgi:hypothetical protein
MAVSISNDGELDRGVANFVDVLDPLVVRGEIVCALCDMLAGSMGLVHGFRISDQSNHLNTASIEFRLQLRESTQFCSANRSKVGRMTKQYSPFAIKELVEVQVAVCSLCLEVGRCPICQYCFQL